MGLATRGVDVLGDRNLNRSIAFGRRERDRLGLRGLLPYVVATDRQMIDRVMVKLERLPRDIDRYMELFLSAARTLAGLVRQSDLDQGSLYRR